jgi:uncharacterized membrane protein
MGVVAGEVKSARGGNGRTPESVAARSMGRSTPRVVSHWIAPMVTVAVVAMVAFGAFYALDIVLNDGGATTAVTVWRHFLAFDTPELISDALPALGMTIVAALGIVLTVVAIIVQLSSDRYTGVALMFLRDPVNILVMSFYIVASLCAVWLSVTLRAEFVPRSLLLLVMVLTSTGLAVMLPYFAYVFWFLEPGNIIDRLRAHTSRLNRRALPPARTSRSTSCRGGCSCRWRKSRTSPTIPSTAATRSSPGTRWMRCAIS